MHVDEYLCSYKYTLINKYAQSYLCVRVAGYVHTCVFIYVYIYLHTQIPYVCMCIRK